MDALAERESLVGDHEVFVEVEDGTKAAARGARPERRVEREVAGLQLVEGDAAVGASVFLGEDKGGGFIFNGRDARCPSALHHDDAVAGLEAELHGVGEAGREGWIGGGGDHEAVHHHVDRVVLLLVERGNFLEGVRDAVHAHAREAGALDLGERLLVAALASLDGRRVQDQLRPGGVFEDRLNDLLRALPPYGLAALRTVRHPHVAVQEAQVVVDFRDGGHDRARIAAGRALFDGDGGG